MCFYYCNIITGYKKRHINKNVLPNFENLILNEPKIFFLEIITNIF